MNPDTLPNYQWYQRLDERQQKEIRLAVVYATQFAHGTTGHNQLMLLAKMAERLSRYEDTGCFLND